ncbi:MAG: cell division protein FtsI (penicillin-binding protein 3) [Actinobacteria bacterium]|jgi:cell division protein FtsI (penicillin-binding protein 3)|nr:cell division protein FtsI (penicillin-binding protein 3) [Actinomycetota bacterium]
MGNFALAHSRIRLLVLVITVFMLLFGVRLVQVQALQAEDYRLRAVNEMENTRSLLAPRGEITDVNGVAFARSVAATSIVVDQTQITNPSRVASFVAPILGLTVEEVKSSISGDRKWSMVFQNAKPATWQKLNSEISTYNEKFPAMSPDRIIGFYPENSYIREYPSGSLVASLVGFVNRSGVGATGLESSMNSIISGVEGKYSYANGYGAEIPGSQSEIIPAQAGTSVRLTIDRDIQWVASRAISDAVKSSRAISGTVIVMDPATGEILAHATAPTFNPNHTSKVSLVAMRNPSVQDVYEPGSTGKIMTVAAALEEKKITSDTVFTIPYKLKRSNEVFRDHEKHPTQRLTVSGVLAVSSNTGTIKIGELLPNQVLYDYLSKFGVGVKTGSGLPGESRGILPEVADWSGTTAPTVAFGQGYSLTSMQATSIFATIANNGVRVSPTVIAGTSDSSGNYTPAQGRTSERVVSIETAKAMRIMMESVVSSAGTAPSAAINGYRVAGKTGTAMRIDDTCGCYRGYTASFIGFAPADKPAYVISVTIQDPKGMHWGGALGGPVFKQVMSFVLQSRHIAPTGTTVIPVALTERELVAKRVASAKTTK